MMWVLFLLIILGIIRHRFYWRVSNKKFLIDEKKVFMSHRGYKKTYPENTIAAFIDAISIGFEWLEMDLMTTKDGVVVCSHNFDLETETNGKGYIFDWKYEKLKYIETGIYSHPQNKQKLPTLNKVLDSIPKNVKYNFEIKSKSTFDLSTTINLLKMIKKRKIKNFLISSFSPIIIAYIKLSSPWIATAFLLESKKYFWLVNWLHPTFINPRADMIDNDLIEYSKKHKCDIITWTINNDVSLEFLKNKKSINIITDKKV